MRALLITLFLFISVVVAEEAGVGKVVNPAEDAGIGETVDPAKEAEITVAITPAKDHGIGGTGGTKDPAEDAGVGETTDPAEDAGIGETMNPAEDAGVGETMDPAEEAGIGETTNLAKHVGISKAINHILNGQPQAYKSPRFKRFVTHCSSHVAETCSDPMHHDGGIHSPFGLSFCLFDSMEACLVDHKASLYPSTSSENLNPKPTKVQYLPVLIQTVKFQTVLRTCSQVTAQSCLSGSNVDASVLAACLLPSLNQCVYPTQVSPPSGKTSLIVYMI
ncbi:hypothetical protein VNO80_28158 [Phaseolus coccineus]|uniref:Uncharacterized protein n=1 Tax=Phaseolus coccineus TaxID=3886 RepID=A0AAN9LKV9_PHACN